MREETVKPELFLHTSGAADIMRVMRVWSMAAVVGLSVLCWVCSCAADSSVGNGRSASLSVGQADGTGAGSAGSAGSVGSAGGADRGKTGGMDSLLAALDRAVEGRAKGEAQRLARIEELALRNSVLDPVPMEKYACNLSLHREYRQYQCDSAIVYLNRNMELAERMNDPARLTETRLLLASTLELAGLYKESVDVLGEIDPAMVPADARLEYMFCHRQVYSSLAEHTKDGRLAARYLATSRRYDSLTLAAVGERDDELALRAAETCLLAEGRFDDALRVNDTRLARAAEGGADYAYIAYHRAMNHAGRGDAEMEKRWLVRSAIADMEAGIKDYAALWMVAERLFNEGDVERAYRYIQVSWSDTQFYNARLRRIQTAGIQHMIDENFQQMLRRSIVTIRSFALLAGLLAILLAAALVLLRRQNAKLRTARDELSRMNGRLNELNDELRHTNDSLRHTNASLSESNLVKEKYIGHFLSLCSVYIDRLDAYRRMTHKKLRKGQADELLRVTEPQENLDSDLKEFYANFDATFLQLFPDFVAQYNGLLHEGEAAVPKKDELLNTELRIFALIRLGIEDSVHIAEFLRYSLNTIYNYRAKARNKARGSRDEFEELVKRIR